MAQATTTRTAADRIRHRRPGGDLAHAPWRLTPAMPRLAPEIFRKRLLIEGYFARPSLDAQGIRDYFSAITARLGLRTYGQPIVHQTSGQGKTENEGFDAFVPLIDSGIYVCVWSGPRFLSVILYTCAEFDETQATRATRDFFEMTEWDSALF